MVETGYSNWSRFLHWQVFQSTRYYHPFNIFTCFFPESLISKIVEQTNLYSVQTTGRNVNTNVEEMTKFIGMNLLMGIVKLPTYFQTLQYPGIADHMSRNRFSSLKRFLHFVDNNADIESNDKLAKVRPVIDAVRDCCVLVEPEEFHSIDKQIIPSKTKYSKVRQYNPKNGISKILFEQAPVDLCMTFMYMMVEIFLILDSIIQKKVLKLLQDYLYTFEIMLAIKTTI